MRPPAEPAVRALALALAAAAVALVPTAHAFGNVGEPADCSCPVHMPPAFVVDPGWGTHTCARSQRWGSAVCAATSPVDVLGSDLIPAGALAAMMSNPHGLAHASALGQHEHLRVSRHLHIDEHPDFESIEKAPAPARAAASLQTIRATQRARLGAREPAAAAAVAVADGLGHAELARELELEKALEAHPQLTIELGSEADARALVELAYATDAHGNVLHRSGADAGAGAPRLTAREALLEKAEARRQQNVLARAELEKALEKAGTTTVKVLALTALPSPASRATDPQPDAYPLVSLRPVMADGSRPEFACTLSNYGGSVANLARAYADNLSPTLDPPAEFVCPTALKARDIVKVGPPARLRPRCRPRPPPPPHASIVATGPAYAHACTASDRKGVQSGRATRTGRPDWRSDTPPSCRHRASRAPGTRGEGGAPRTGARRACASRGTHAARGRSPARGRHDGRVSGRQSRVDGA